MGNHDRRCVGTRGGEPQESAPKTSSFRRPRGHPPRRQQRAQPTGREARAVGGVFDGGASPRGWTSQLGGPGSPSRQTRSRGPGETIPTGRRQPRHADLGQEQAVAVKVGPSEGNRSEGTTEHGESEGRRRAKTSGNGRHPDRSSKGDPCWCEPLGVNMNDASTSRRMSPELQRVAERAKREPEAKFHSLAQLLDEQRSLGRTSASARTRPWVWTESPRSSTGRTCGATRDLHARMVAKQYRHQPIRRVHIPKDQGKTRPIGISTVEDKVVQNALSEVLEAIYEQDFMDCSYGFRPGRSAHDAVRALTEAVDSGEANFVLEIDLASYFDSIDRTMLMEVAPDPGGRWVDAPAHQQMHACGSDGGRGSDLARRGTAQGSTLSPLAERQSNADQVRGRCRAGI